MSTRTIARALGRTSLLAAALLAPATLAGAAAENPLQPLTAVAKHLETSFASFLGGKSPEEAFAPWQGSVSGDGADAIRTPFRAAGAVAAKSFFLEVELHYLREKKAVYRVRLGLWLTPEGAALLDVGAAPREGGEAPSGSIATDTTSETLQPFAKAARALDAALKGEGWKDVPFVDPAKLAEVLGPALGAGRMDAARKEIAESKTVLERAAGEVKALGADALVVHLDDQGSIAVDSAGKVVGMLSGEFDVGEDGRLRYEIERYKEPPKKE